MLRALARAKARERPQWLRASAVQAFHQRWSGIIAVAALPLWLACQERAWTPWMAPLRPGPRCWRPHASARLRKPAGCRCGPADGPRAVAARRRGRLLRPCRRKRFTLLARKTTCLTLDARKKERENKNEVIEFTVNSWLSSCHGELSPRKIESLI